MAAINLMALFFLSVASGLQLQPQNEKVVEKDGSLGKILLVSAVGSAPQTIDLIMAGVNHLRGDYSGQVDVFLMHYDETNSAWLARDSSWYDENVQKSFFAPGLKFSLLKKEITDYQMIDQYSWIWVIDEDIDISETNVSQMIALADESGSPIVGPAILNLEDNVNDSFLPARDFLDSQQKVVALQLANSRDGLGCQAGDMRCSLQSARAECRWSYTKFIEVMTPLLRPQALWQSMRQCEECITDISTWGLNSMWCSIAAKTFELPKDRACALIDQASILHTNFKSHKKYKSDGDLNQPVYDQNQKQKYLVKRLYPDDFDEVDGSWLPVCVH